MSKLTEVGVYLLEKIGSINVNNPKANSGAVLLRMSNVGEEEMQKLVSTIVFPLLQQQFSKSGSSSPAGTAKLTHISTLIGNKVAGEIMREPLPWAMQVRLGDLFLEAFKVVGLVDVYRIFLSNVEQHYIVSATNEWTELADIPEMLDSMRLIGTTLKVPSPITGAFQYVNRRPNEIVKGGYKGDFSPSSTWVQAINKLQKTSWRINERVLRALQENEDSFISNEPIKDNDAKEQKRRSKKVEWSFILSKAKRLTSKTFYQHVEADYRGRLYYIEPFLNYQGSEIARGLMEFSRGKPMTESGLQWLAIHTASCFNMSYNIDEIPEWCTADYYTLLKEEGIDNISVDRMTLEDRIQWTNEYMDEIREAGHTVSLSHTAEKPVCFLACCLEWADIHNAMLDNRIHLSHLPIPIDGKTNGWQHLGAISKDLHTGRLVGLIPVEIQEDFYIKTAQHMNEFCENERALSLLQTMPMKKIRKGISKRGSMTRAYSAGTLKIAENMFFDCKTEDYHTEFGITEKDCYNLSKALIKAIDKVCPGPLTTMSYLQNLAAFEIGKYTLFNGEGKPMGKYYKQINARRKQLCTQEELTEEELEELDHLTKECKTFTYKLTYGNGSDVLTWTTPSDFYVHYENWIPQSLKAHGRIDGQYIYHVAQVPSHLPNIRGFMCGISPNFIHSLDASHLSMVVAQWNGDFGAVHDSYSTHACDVEDLLELTKSVFIDIYSVDNFYDYIESTLLTSKDALDVSQPEVGELNLNDIRECDFFFS